MTLNEGTVFAERYVLSKLLGRGGFSEVWLAQDNKSGLDIALKVYAPYGGLDDKGAEMFSKEFSLVFNVNHTNLLTPTYYDVYERSPYLIMPFCGKGSANSLIGCASADDLLRILHDVAAGLAYLHSQEPPVIHQDIKPDNILLNDHGDYVITDFGISTKARSTLRKSVIASENSGGTYGYMGPERFSKNPAPVKASDVWSLGSMAFELLEGNTPFDNIGGAMQKNGAEIPEIKSDVPETLKKLIYSCLAKETWDRPSASEIVEMTESLMRGEDLSTVPGHEASPAIPEDKRTIGFGKKTVGINRKIEDGHGTVRSFDGANIGSGTRRLDEDADAGSSFSLKRNVKWIVTFAMLAVIIAGISILLRHTMQKSDVDPAVIEAQNMARADSLSSVILDETDIEGGYIDEVTQVTVHTAGYYTDYGKKLLNNPDDLYNGIEILQRVIEQQYKSSAEAAAVLAYVYAVKNAGSSPDPDYISLINPSTFDNFIPEPDQSSLYSDIALKLDPDCYQARFEKCLDYIGGKQRGFADRRILELKPMFDAGKAAALRANDVVYIRLYEHFGEKYAEALDRQ